MRQIGFSFRKNYKKEFGGSLLKGKRKGQRPLSTRHPIHLIFKSKTKLFHPANSELVQILKHDARKLGIKIYDMAVNWNHIHLLIKIPSRQAYTRFVRATTSRIVAYFRRQSGWEIAGLFDLRPYTKILTWGRQFLRARKYQLLNQIEAQFGKRARVQASRAKEKRRGPSD